MRVAVRDSFQLRQQSFDTRVQQLASPFALFVFVTRKQTEFPVERFNFFLYPPDLSEHSLNLVEHAGMFSKWEVATLQSADQLIEIFNARLATDENLRAAGIAHKVGLPILVDTLIELPSTEKTGELLHTMPRYSDFLLSDALSLAERQFSAVYASLSALRSSDDTSSAALALVETSRIHCAQSRNTREHFC